MPSDTDKYERDGIEMIFSHATADGKEGQLGIDPKGNLYWNGKSVAMVHNVKLQWWVNAAAIVAGISAALAGINIVLGWFGIPAQS